MTASIAARTRFLRHLQARRVVLRLTRMAKRRAIAGLAAHLSSLRHLDQGPMPVLKADLPQPLFPPRGGATKTPEGGYEMRFLSRSHRFGPNIDWNYNETEQGACLWQMNLHYMEYLESLAPADAVALVEHWIAANPPYGQRYWWAVWNSYSVSIRVVVWMQQLARHREALSPETRPEILRSLRQQLRFLRANLELDIGGNHLIKNIKALLWAGAFFADREFAGLAASGRRLLEEALAEQILADGLHFERSPSYHAQVFADLLECYQVLEEGALKERLGEALDRMAAALGATTEPDGYPPLFNDAGMTMAYTPGDCLAVHARLRAPLRAPAKVIKLHDAGYYGWREGDNYLLIDCGPLGPDGLMAHAHADILSFVWSPRGERMILDAGVYEYRAGERRAYARATKAHNTLSLDDEDQCEFIAPFRVGRRAHGRCTRFEPRHDGFLLEGEHSGYAYLPGCPIHRRRFDFSSGRLIIEDEVLGGAGQSAVARLLLHEDCSVRESGKALVIERGNCRLSLESSGSLSVEDAWRYPDMGREVRTKRICIAYGSAPCKGHMRLTVETKPEPTVRPQVDALVEEPAQ